MVFDRSSGEPSATPPNARPASERWRAVTGSSPNREFSAFMTVLNSAGLFQCLAFGCDALQQIVPGLIELLGPFAMELNGKGVDVDARPAEAAQHLLTVP